MANIWPPIYRKHTLSDLSSKIEENNVSIFFYYELKCISYGIYWVLAHLLPKNGQITPNQEENGQKHNITHNPLISAWNIYSMWDIRTILPDRGSQSGTR